MGEDLWLHVGFTGTVLWPAVRRQTHPRG